MRTIEETEIMEARYDSMPPEAVRELRFRSADPLTIRHHALQAEMAFARRMFRASRNFCKARNGLESDNGQLYRNDCRHWWRRYRGAQASAAELRNLIALKGLGSAILA